MCDAFVLEWSTAVTVTVTPQRETAPHNHTPPTSPAFGNSAYVSTPHAWLPSTWPDWRRGAAFHGRQRTNHLAEGSANPVPSILSLSPSPPLRHVALVTLQDSR